MNFFCFVVHFSMVAVTYHMAYRRHGLWAYETDHMDVRIHRISMIPTPEMIRQNLTQWGAGWNGSLAVTEFYIKDNGLSVRTQLPNDPLGHTAHIPNGPWQVNYATLVMVFFAISAVFHFCAPPAPPEPDAPLTCGPSHWQGRSSWAPSNVFGSGIGGSSMTASRTGGGSSTRPRPR